MNNKSLNMPFAAVAVITMAFLLRLYKLNEGLWFDEILTAVRYVRLPFVQLLFAFDSENQHFLYSILAHFSVQLFGESAFALRVPAALFGTCAIWLLYLFACKVTNRNEALLASALLAVSYFHVWFSQNARGYTGLQFWTIASAILLLRAFETNFRKVWLLYAMTLALGMYTQLTMLFVPAGHFLMYLHKRKSLPGSNWNGLWFGFVLGGVFTLLLYSPVLVKMMNTLGEESTVALWKQPLWTLLEIIRGMKLHFAGGFVAVIALIIFLGGLINYWKSNPIVVQLLLLPVLIGSVVTIAMGHPLWPRFFFFNFAFAMLVLVRGIFWISTLLSKQTMPAVAACFLLIAASAWSLPRVYAPKQDFLQARSFLEQQTEPGDTIATVGRISFVYQDFYHLPFERAQTLAALQRLESKSDRLWIVYILPEDARALYADVMNVVEREFPLVQRFEGTLNGGTIYVRRK